MSIEGAGGTARGNQAEGSYAAGSEGSGEKAAFCRRGEQHAQIPQQSHHQEGGGSSATLQGGATCTPLAWFPRALQLSSPRRVPPHKQEEQTESLGWFSSGTKVELAKKKEELQAAKTDLESKIRENGCSPPHSPQSCSVVRVCEVCTPPLCARLANVNHVVGHNRKAAPRKR